MDNPKGYNVIKSVDEALLWLGEGKWHVDTFSGGIVGLSNSVVGGCWGLFADGVIDQLQAQDYLKLGSDDVYRITRAGWRAAALL